MSCFHPEFVLRTREDGSKVTVLDAYCQCMEQLKDLPDKQYSFKYDRFDQWVESIAMSKHERWARDLQREGYVKRIQEALVKACPEHDVLTTLRPLFRDTHGIWHTSDQFDVEIYVLSCLLFLRFLNDETYRHYVKACIQERRTVGHDQQEGVDETICTYACKYIFEHGVLTHI